MPTGSANIPSFARGNCCCQIQGKLANDTTAASAAAASAAAAPHTSSSAESFSVRPGSSQRRQSRSGSLGGRGLGLGGGRWLLARLRFLARWAERGGSGNVEPAIGRRRCGRRVGRPGRARAALVGEGQHDSLRNSRDSGKGQDLLRSELGAFSMRAAVFVATFAQDLVQVVALSNLVQYLKMGSVRRTVACPSCSQLSVQYIQ